VVVGQALSPANRFFHSPVRERFAELRTTGANLCRVLFAAALFVFFPTNSILGLDIKIAFI
jgi:hypothetical protein